MLHNEPKKGVGCFFCGEPDTFLIHDPKEFYRPCVACHALMRQGVTVYGFTAQPKKGLPPITTTATKQKLYPEGQFVVLAEGVPEKLMPKTMAEPSIKAGSAFLPTEIVNGIRAILGLDDTYSLITMDDIDRADALKQKESEVPLNADTRN